MLTEIANIFADLLIFGAGILTGVIVCMELDAKWDRDDRED